MSSIFGIVNRRGALVKRKHAQTMLKVMNHWGATSESDWKNDTVYFGGLKLYRDERQSYVEQLHVLLADATLFNKEELKKKLGLNSAENYADTVLLLQAYLKWGKDCSNYLNGAFAFVIYDQNTNEVFVVRDHHGIKPLYYFSNDEYFAFATEMKGLLCLPFVSKEVNEQYVADFICRIWLDNTQTLYKNVHRFPPAHYATINDRAFQMRKYWKAENIRPISFKKEADYVDAFEEMLIRAVKVRAEGSLYIGTELSGGLDSSLVTALLSKQKGKNLSSYSYVLPTHLEGKGLFSDSDKVIEVAKKAGITDLELLIDEGKGMLDSLAWNLNVHDEPPFEFNALFRDGLYQKMHKKGQRLLFSGFGGDEMVSSQASGYLKQLYKEGKKSLLKEEIKAISKRKRKSEWLLYSSLYFKLLAGDRFVTSTVKAFYSLSGKESELQKKLKHRPLLEHWFKQLNMEDRFNAYQKRYSRNGNFIEDQIRRLQEPHVSMRLEYQAQAARSFQLDYRYPLLDVDLIELYLGLPTEFKARNGYGRYIFKKVMERHLPKDFVWRETKKGSSNPQVLNRTLNDGKKVQEKLFSIEGNHPLWNYLDREKLKNNRIKFKDWNQSTTDFVYLLLADKLE